MKKDEKTTKTNATRENADNAQGSFGDASKTKSKSQTKTSDKTNGTTSAHMSKSDKTDFVIGLSVMLVVFAAFFGLITFAASRTRGEIAMAGNSRRGSEQIFSYKNTGLQKGDTVSWFVNGEKMADCAYDGNAAEFSFVPQKTGNTVVKVKAGNFTQATVVNVQKPVLTVTAKDVEMTYGEEIPEFEYECEGWVGDENESCLDCRIGCGDKIGCGKFDIEVEATSEDYEVVTKNGTLKVNPREVTLKNVAEKVYDQTTAIDSATVIAEGILEGDDVRIAGEWKFEGKDVGLQKIDTSNITLTGEDSANYTVCENIEGRILPREVTLDGLTIADKNYDGTTKAKIAKMGKLNGVLDGDSVAVGSIEVAFEAADIGTQKVNVKNVKLVGFDKDNYVLKNVTANEAEIK